MLNTPGALRLQIGIFGKRNAGKSSLFNALSGQESSIVSDVPGTTADPVFKAMEIPVLGPVLLMDTAGLDDDDALLGGKRVDRSRKVLERADLILLVTEGFWGEFEEELLREARKRKTPVIVVFNKADLRTPERPVTESLQNRQIDFISLSAKEKTCLDLLLKRILKNTPEDFRNQNLLLDGVVRKGDLLLMVTPIDSAAPRGRLILPQVQAIRDALDHEAYSLAVKENALPDALEKLKALPDLVITDSQVFGPVYQIAFGGKFDEFFPQLIQSYIILCGNRNYWCPGCRRTIKKCLIRLQNIGFITNHDKRDFTLFENGGKFLFIL